MRKESVEIQIFVLETAIYSRRLKMKCTYCLVDDILLLEEVFPSLFAILEDGELFQPFKPKISAN